MTTTTTTPTNDAAGRLRPGKPLFMTEEQARGKLLSGHAIASAQRLINAFFGNEGERPRASIPARPDYDDDLILIDVLRYAEEVVRHTVQAGPDDVAQRLIRADPNLMRVDDIRDLFRGAGERIEAQTAELARLRAPTHRHVKRGTEYRHIGTARIQSDEPLTDYAEVEIYIGAEGDLWARRKVEFHDGRFAVLSSQPASEKAEEEIAQIDNIAQIIHAAMMKMVTADQAAQQSADQSVIVRTWARRAAGDILAAISERTNP